MENIEIFYCDFGKTVEHISKYGFSSKKLGATRAGPLADSHEVKGFFIKAILGEIKVVSLKF